MADDKKQIITDINADLIEKLSSGELEYFNKIKEKNNKNYFLHMPKETRKKLMAGGLNKHEEELIWRYGSTKALHYINDGFGYMERAKAIGRLGRILLGIGCCYLVAGVYFHTYAKSKQVAEYMGTTAQQEEGRLAINTRQHQLIKPEMVMDGTRLLSNIGDCSPLVDISDSFYQAGGNPFCRKDATGTIWVASYVKAKNDYGVVAQPVLLLVKDGKPTNVELHAGEKNPFGTMPSVSLASVEKQLELAFNNNKKGDTQ
jgi:hypothetical protein